MKSQYKKNLHFDYQKALIDLRGPYQEHKHKLKIDLHCHDYNSDVPDELWGRLLQLRETWVTSEELFDCLKRNRTDVTTITNHNNARSCWDMLEKGHDVLPGAEFTCFFEEYNLYLHVLAYGFSPAQEEKLNELRKNIFAFAAYCRKHEIPTILPHPLYFYSKGKEPPMEAYEKLALIFERFEGLNGQRDIWQNLLTVEWIRSLTPEKIEALEKKHNISSDIYCRNPYKKSISGGTDDHLGILAGSCGTTLYVDDIITGTRMLKPSELALEAIWRGNFHPYGNIADEEKLTIAFLDYLCQVVLNMKDPGLVRLLLHKGSLKDKAACFILGNGLLELQRHKYTTKYLKTFHKALQGHKPSFLLGLAAPKEYKQFITPLVALSQASKSNDREKFENELHKLVPNMFTKVSKLIGDRVQSEITHFQKRREFKSPKFEVPLHLRHLFKNFTKNDQGFNLGKTLDKLSFPALFSLILTSAKLVASRALNSNHDFLNKFAHHLGRYEKDNKILWLIDGHEYYKDTKAWSDLKSRCENAEINIEFMICSQGIPTDPKIKYTHSLTTLDLQEELVPEKIAIPDWFELHTSFKEGDFDQVICTGEVMGLAGLFLQQAFSIPVSLHIQTDWLARIDHPSKPTPYFSQVRRYLRAFYGIFDNLLCSSEAVHKRLLHQDMDFKEEEIDYFAETSLPKCLFPKNHCSLEAAGEEKAKSSSFFEDFLKV